MSETEQDKEKQKKYYPVLDLSKNARVKSMDEYKAMWKKSVEDIEGFWGEEAKMVDIDKRLEKEIRKKKA